MLLPHASTICPAPVPPRVPIDQVYWKGDHPGSRGDDHCPGVRRHYQVLELRRGNRDAIVSHTGPLASAG
jgi:hypothetical protein